MININGVDFENYDEAVSFLQEKQKEEKRKLEEQRIADEKAKVKLEISKFFQNLHMKMVATSNEKNYVVAVFSNEPNADKFPEVIIEEEFGPQNVIKNGKLTKAYFITNVGLNEEKQIEELLNSKIKSICRCERGAFSCPHIKTKNDKDIESIILRNYMPTKELSKLLQKKEEKDCYYTYMEEFLNDFFEDFGVR